MESISAADMSDVSSKPLDVGSMSPHSRHDEGLSSSGHPAKSRKRKPNANDNQDSHLDMATASGLDMVTRNGILKKPRLDSPVESLTPTQVFRAPKDKSGLPREIWNHICLFLPPRALGNLLRVNKLFNSHLDPKSRFVVEEQSVPLAQSIVRPMAPNNIWRRARRAFWPKTPGPFKDMTELDMWRLACSTACQFCGKKDTRPQLPLSDPYRHGPGADGVAYIWEFRARTCGACLSSKTINEMDIILSTASTFFLPALPFVIVNEANIVIPLHVIETGKLSPTETLSKLFWSPDVECLREEFLSVKELGPAAAGEWQKGLSLRGSQRRAEAVKWQKYEDAGGVTDMRTLLQHNNVRTKAASHEHATVVPAKSALQVTGREALKSVLTAPPPAPEKTAIADPAPKTAEKTKEEIDAEWDEIQGPVRLKILKYADEAITGDWDDGEKVNKNNAPSFAADVLLHVRKRFYTEVENEAKAARVAGQEPVIDPPEGPFTRKLSLENMKYVFDVKIKPITGNLRKELFLCNDCDYNGKFFGFEGVIQHFASKHTTILSKGSIVVAWRAEWPVHPPFKCNPKQPKGSSQLTLPAKPPSSRSARKLPERHEPQGSSHGHMHVPEHSRPSQPTQHLLHHTAVFTAQSMAAPLHGQPQYYPGPAYAPHFADMPFPQPGTHSEGGPQEHIVAPSSQHNSQPQVGPEAYRGYSDPDYYRGDYLAHGNFPGGHGMDAVPTSADGPLPSSGVGTPGFTSAGQDQSQRAPYRSSAVLNVDTESKLNEIAIHANDLWKATEDMRSVPAAVRRYTVHFHLNNIYEERYNEPLPLALFIKALATREEMRPMRSGHVRFPCKACQFSLGREWTTQIREGTHLILELYNHFENTHLFRTENGKLTRKSLDWLTDMLLLPTPKALSAMAGKRGRTFPLLSQSLQGLSSRKPGSRPATKKIIYKDRSRRYSPQNDHADTSTKGGTEEQMQSEGANKSRGAKLQWTGHESQRGDMDAKRRERQSSVVIKREESLGPELPSVRAPPLKGSTVAAPEVSGRDILGALEMHLNHVPPEHKSAIQHDSRRFVDEERAGASYDRYAETHRQHEVVSPKYHNEARGTEVRERPQANSMKVGMVSRGVTRFPDEQNAAAQYREILAPPARHGQYITAYGYDDRGPQSYSQPRQAPLPPPPPPRPQQYAPALRDSEYRDRYTEKGSQPMPAQADYEPYETYEVVRVVHPEGDYLVRRPIRRVTEPEPAHQYYRQAAPPMYGDAGWASDGQPLHGQEYYSQPGGYVRARPATNMADEAPVHGMPEASRERIVAASPRQTREPTMAPQHENYYEEYDPHYPTTTAGNQQGHQKSRDGGRHQERYQ